MEKILEAFRKVLIELRKLSQVSQILVVGALVFVAFTFGKCDSNSKLNQFRAEFSLLQKEASTAKKFADSTKTEVIRLTNESKEKDSIITKLSFTVEFTNKKRDRLKNVLTVLEDSLTNAIDTTEIVAVQEGIIDNLKEQVKEAETVIANQSDIIKSQQFKITKLDSAVALANARGDSLQTVVNKLIDMPKPPRQFIGKKTAGILAFTAGVIVGDRLARR